MEKEFDIDLLDPNSQFEEDTRFDVVLTDDPGEIAITKGIQLRSSFIVPGSNLGGSEEQPQRVIDKTISNNALTVQCDLAQVIHGTWVKGGSPATLVVFQFAFVPRSNRRRFKEAEISISFSAGDVQAITPENTWATLQSEKQEELSHSLSPGLEAAFGPVNATMGYTWEMSESKTVEGRASVVGLTQALGQTGSMTRARKNTVFWGLYENPQTDSGIPSFMQTAVLLKRETVEGEPLGQKFSADITISGRVDNREWVNDKWTRITKTMSGKSRKGEEIIFNPEKNRGTVDDVHNLKDVKLDIYKQLVTIRTWVDGDEKPPEQKREAPDALGQDPAIKPSSEFSPTTVISSTTQSATTVHPPVEHLAETVTQHPTANSTSKTPRSQLDVAAFASLDSTLVGSLSQDTASEGRSVSLKDNDRQRRLHYLEEQRSLIRYEASLLTQLVALAREERMVSREIEDTRD